MGWLTDWKRTRVLAKHRVDDALWRQVAGALPFLDGLSEEEMRRLRDLALLFLSEKEFSGAAGLEVTEAMRLSIAVQACLPILELGLDWYAGWSGVVIYPGDFRVRKRETDEAGVVHEWDEELSGEAWSGGPVIISWDAAAHDEYISVVIHEFAHKLDMAEGEADGMPPLHAGMDRARWARSFRRAYDEFCAAVDRGEDTPLDPYASEHPSEFFAVLSEAFFEAPLLVRTQYAELYELLRQFYRQDPAARMDIGATDGTATAPRGR
jgi:Mlc titration factor MtfA (ptsG expression regulator)